MPPVHHKKYYQIPKGKLLLSSDGVAWDDVGNCTEVECTLEVTEEEHFSSRTGLKNRDELIVTQQKGTGKYITDSIHKNNLEKWLMANGITETTQAAVVAGTKILAGVALDVWYDIGKYNISTVVVKDSGEITTYTEGTDYVLDTAAGLIMFPSSGGNIAAGVDIHITAYDAAETDVSTMDAASVTQKQVHAWFVSAPANGEIIDVKGFVSLKPSGAFKFISDTWNTIEVSLEFIANSAYDNKPFRVIRRGNTAD